MASPRPMPPATKIGTSRTAGRISCASTDVATGPIWPPASMPSMISASAPILTSFLPIPAARAQPIERVGRVPHRVGQALHTPRDPPQPSPAGNAGGDLLPALPAGAARLRGVEPVGRMQRAQRELRIILGDQNADLYLGG